MWRFIGPLNLKLYCWQIRIAAASHVSIRSTWNWSRNLPHAQSHALHPVCPGQNSPLFKQTLRPNRIISVVFTVLSLPNNSFTLVNAFSETPRPRIYDGPDSIVYPDKDVIENNSFILGMVWKIECFHWSTQPCTRAAYREDCCSQSCQSDDSHCGLYQQGTVWESEITGVIPEHLQSLQSCTTEYNQRSFQSVTTKLYQWIMGSALASWATEQSQ